MHWPNPVWPAKPLFEALAALRRDGLVRHVGVSNYSLGRWQEADRLLGSPVLSNQVRYNLVDRRPEADVLPWAQANDRLVVAYSPLAQGFLSARYSVGDRPGGMRKANPLFLPENLA